MTTPIAIEDLPEPPFEVFFTSAHTVCLGTAANGHAILSYGQTLIITRELIELSLDLNGHSTLLARLASGTAGIHLGPWPDGVSRLLPGSMDWSEAREAARRQAWKIEDESERKSALAHVQAEFGSAPTSKTLQVTT